MSVRLKQKFRCSCSIINRWTRSNSFDKMVIGPSLWDWVLEFDPKPSRWTCSINWQKNNTWPYLQNLFFSDHYLHSALCLAIPGSLFFNLLLRFLQFSSLKKENTLTIMSFLCFLNIESVTRIVLQMRFSYKIPCRDKRAIERK